MTTQDGKDQYIKILETALRRISNLVQDVEEPDYIHITIKGICSTVLT